MSCPNRTHGVAQALSQSRSCWNARTVSALRATSHAFREALTATHVHLVQSIERRFHLFYHDTTCDVLVVFAPGNASEPCVGIWLDHPDVAHQLPDIYGSVADAKHAENVLPMATSPSVSQMLRFMRALTKLEHEDYTRNARDTVQATLAALRRVFGE